MHASNEYFHAWQCVLGTVEPEQPGFIRRVPDRRHIELHVPVHRYIISRSGVLFNGSHIQKNHPLPWVNVLILDDIDSPIRNLALLLHSQEGTSFLWASLEKIGEVFVLECNSETSCAGMPWHFNRHDDQPWAAWMENLEWHLRQRLHFHQCASYGSITAVRLHIPQEKLQSFGPNFIQEQVSAFARRITCWYGFLKVKNNSLYVLVHLEETVAFPLIGTAEELDSLDLVSRQHLAHSRWRVRQNPSGPLRTLDGWRNGKDQRRVRLVCRVLHLPVYRLHPNLGEQIFLRLVLQWDCRVHDRYELVCHAHARFPGSYQEN